MIRTRDVTEKVISQAGLTSDEAKVIRVFYDLPSGGGRTREWAGKLSAQTYEELLSSGKFKIQQFLDQRAGK